MEEMKCKDEVFEEVEIGNELPKVCPKCGYDVLMGDNRKLSCVRCGISVWKTTKPLIKEIKNPKTKILYCPFCGLDKIKLYFIKEKSLSVRECESCGKKFRVMNVTI